MSSSSHVWLMFPILNCARMVLGYVEDCLCLSNTHPEQMCVDLSEPFYILELGSGSGKFCHYVLRALEVTDILPD